MGRRAVGGLWLALACGLWMGCKEGPVGGSSGARFQASPDALDFGLTALGNPRALELVVRNEGRTALQVLEAAPSIANVEVEDFAPFTLGGGESRTLRVIFSPAVEGDVQGVIVLRADGGARDVQVSVAGVGVRALLETQTTLVDFGDVELGGTRMEEIVLRNPTRVSASVRVEFDGPDVDQFSSSATELLVPPGKQRALPVAFRPARLGVAQGFVRLSLCAGCPPMVEVELLGSGVASMLEISPMALDFGRVTLGATARLPVTLTNLGIRPFELRDVSVLDDPDGVFQISSQSWTTGALLPAGGRAELDVSFSPRVMRTVHRSILQIDVLEPGASGPGPRLRIRGEGGGSCVSFFPRAVDFGLVAEGMSASRRVEVLNRCTREVQLGALAVSTQSGGYFSLDQPGGGAVIAPGASAAIGVVFTPRAGAGASRGSLSFRVAQGGAASTEQVALTGEGRHFAPCQYGLSPPAALDYGRVPVGAEVTLGVALRNTGTEPCFVSGMQLASGSDPEFSATPLAGRSLAPGEQALLRIRFRPSAARAFSGMAEAWVNSPQPRDHPTVLLSGEGIDSCFTLQPTTLDFGTARLGCPARGLEIAGFNRCSTPVTVTAARIEAGGSSELMLARGPPSIPHSVPPGGQVTFLLSYQPLGEGEDAAAFRVETAEEGALTAGLIASALQRPTRTDRFFQESQALVDVLFVIDNSGSMSDKQESVARNMAAFLSVAVREGVDYHLGVTTTGIEPSPSSWASCPGGAFGGEAGRLFPVDNSSPRVITPITPGAAGLFANNVRVGICHWSEQGLEAAYRALSPPLVTSADDPSTPLPNDGNAGFLREEAKLAIVIVSDEDDQSQRPVSFYETFFRALKGNDADQLILSAIVGPEDLSSCPSASGSGSRYIALANALGGVVESICTPDWTLSLERLSHSAFGLRRSFRLSGVPSDVAAIRVDVNGLQVLSGWSYDAAQQSVVFEESAVPPAGSVIDVTYPVGC